MSKLGVVKVIAFDLAGTLIPSEDWEALSLAHLRLVKEELARRDSISIEEAEKLIKERRMELTQNLGYVPTFVDTVETLGIEKKKFYNLIDSVNPLGHLTPNRKVAMLLVKLRERLRLCIVTNVSRKTTERALEAYGIEPQLFSYVFCGDEMKETKPSLYPFKMLLKKIGEKAHNVVVVGDRIDIDLVPAKKLGMKTVLISPIHINSKSVDAVVHKLHDLLDILSISCNKKFLFQ